MTDKLPDQAVQAADKAVEQVKHAADTVKRETQAHGGVGGNAAAAVKQADRFILRLNKLLATPGGLSAFLSTSNYILYVLAYLQPRASPLYTRLLAALKLSSSPVPLKADPNIPHPVAALAQLLSKCRTTLRLLGTLPLYAWLRSLMAGPKPGSDAVLHKIAVAQASSYFAYQILENICVLADNGIVPASFVARLNRSEPTTARLYTTAYRFWLVGVSCDFLRLAREAQNISAKRAARSQGEKGEVATRDEDAQVDKRWWMDAAIATAWFPMALHFSNVTGGVPGWHAGWMGVCGLVAGGERMRGLWAATA
ncbi:uncharacterized protein CC84DRAFT_1217793 [Paraphaeosphaeria sporulosa]|uniref:Peroxin 11C n=1 Tax=Paraphaeosphaeria sporulosa TaxID=1460663 RepID=A0A177C998_9PLEO|nr:uncharacterized protein CC84DRAFT_1217793 [Paraphaeosphaeria sporulosa]OAG04324.1 hypothetical protein CC84DRAFT_1217793 [Paraphaeosphaeria sporulosa]